MAVQTQTTKYEIAAQVTLAGLDGQSGKLTAAQQRAVFGANLFGHKTLDLDASGQGAVTAHWSVCFGTDSCFATFTFAEVAAAASGGRPLRFG